MREYVEWGLDVREMLKVMQETNSLMTMFLRNNIKKNTWAIQVFNIFSAWKILAQFIYMNFRNFDKIFCDFSSFQNIKIYIW